MLRSVLSPVIDWSCMAPASHPTLHHYLPELTRSLAVAAEAAAAAAVATTAIFYRESSYMWVQSPSWMV
jgi:hypothetical protein